MTQVARVDAATFGLDGGWVDFYECDRFATQGFCGEDGTGHALDHVRSGEGAPREGRSHVRPSGERPSHRNPAPSEDAAIPSRIYERAPRAEP